MCWLRSTGMLFCLVLLVMMVSGRSVVTTQQQQCHRDINATETGLIQPSIDDLFGDVCTWSVRPSLNTQLLLINHVVIWAPNASLTLVMDGKNVPIDGKTCSTGCRSYGRHLQIVYTRDNSSIALSNVVHFALNYSVVEEEQPECPAPPVPLNGRIVELTGTKLGDRVSYTCNSPHVISNSERAVCQILDTNSSIVPSWSEPAPVCVVPHCAKTPYSIEVDDTEDKWVVNPGYPQDFTAKKAKVCTWEVFSADKMVQITLEELKMQGKGISLMFYDGKMSDFRLLLSVTDSSAQGSVLTTVSNRVVISLKTSKQGSSQSSEVILFKVRLSAVSRVCPTPDAPVNGDVRGAAGHQQQAQYSCDAGYAMNGSEHSFCTDAGVWNSTVPECLTNIFTGPKVSHKESPDQQSTQDKDIQWKMPKSEDNSSDMWTNEYPEEDAELIDVSQIQGVLVEEDEEVVGEFPTYLAIALGVGIPLALAVLAVIIYILYRKLYPVRMSIGRKFGTYENPVYESSKRNPGRSSTLPQTQAELHRLTQSDSP